LSGPEYLALAYRTGAYQGVIAATAAAEEEDEAQDEGTVAPTRDAIEASPLAGLIDWGGSNAGGV
jgi:hypothetical protein